MSNFSRNDPERLARYQRIRKDPFEFLKCVRTLDQVDKITPIKPFPVQHDYIKLFVRVWQKERLLAVPKSRRMIMSWTNVALFLHDALFNVGRQYAFVSKKEDDAHELIERAKFIIDNLDDEQLPRELLPKHEFKYGSLRFPEINSHIRGFPQGADQLRQFTFSGILADEMVFWEDAQKMYAASMPTLEGGGRFTAISSPGAGFFKRLVFDQIDSDGVASEYDAPAIMAKSPIEGVEVWRNARNQFVIFQLHYSANPNKRSTEWQSSIKSSMPRQQYLQEYELRWDSYAGLPVYSDFDMKRHACASKPSPENGLPLLRGWDFGLTPAAIVAQLQGDTLVVFKEFVELNMGADRFSDRVLGQSQTLWPEWSGRRTDWIDFIDPSGEFRKDTDEGTCAKILDSKGLKCIPGAIAFEERRKSVETFLLRQSRTGPAFQIDASECPVTVRGFQGGYRYPEKSAEIEPLKVRPIKDEHSHPHDALQMITSRITMTRNQSKTPIPRLSYGWDKRT